MPQIIDTTRETEPKTEKSDLHKRLDRASVLHEALHGEASYRNFVEFRDRQAVKQPPK